jgi:hypothetical protein
MHTSLKVMQAYVAGQAQLGYASFSPGPSPSDVILVAYPKSGSTWTSYLLHQLRSRGDHEFDDIKHEVVDITPGHWDPARNPFLEKQRFEPRTFKTHGSSRLAPAGARYIYLARDPTDSLYSLYNFIHDLFDLRERVPIEEFYRLYFVERFGTGHDIGNAWGHLTDWIRMRGDGRMLWLHYEDLLEDLPRCLEGIAGFMGVDLDDELFTLVLERSKMAAIRDISAKLNPSQDNYVGRLTRAFSPETDGYASRMQFGKMRKGVAGDGRQNMPEALLAELESEWRARVTPTLGYRNYAEIREDCSFLKGS